MIITEWDIDRINCTGGQSYDRVEAHMGSHGGVTVFRSSHFVADLPPSAGCTVTRIEGLQPGPIAGAPPDSMLLGLGIVAVAIAIGCAVVAGMAMARVAAFVLWSPPYIAPPPPSSPSPTPGCDA